MVNMQQTNQFVVNVLDLQRQSIGVSTVENGMCMQVDLMATDAQNLKT